MNNRYANVEYKGLKTLGVTDYTNQTPSILSILNGPLVRRSRIVQLVQRLL